MSSALFRRDFDDSQSKIQAKFPMRRTFIDTIVQRNDEYWENRIVLEMDISYTDHSHIIGRNGKNLQRINRETACHVHCPDSNKNQQFEKSNLVTIAGSLENVEQARQRIREMSPLQISFNLHGLLPQVDVSELMGNAALEKTMGFDDLNIIVRTLSSGQPYMLIRGSVHQSATILNACKHIKNQLFGPHFNLTYQTSLEVLPPQQNGVLGPNEAFVNCVCNLTGASIGYPRIDKSPPEVRDASTFFIEGSAEAVIKARKWIIGLLPARMKFRLVNCDGTPPLPYQTVEELERSLDLQISFDTSSNGRVNMSVCSREMNLSNVYSIRPLLIKGSGPVVCSEYKEELSVLTALNNSLRQIPPVNQNCWMMPPQIDMPMSEHCIYLTQCMQQLSMNGYTFPCMDQDLAPSNMNSQQSIQKSSDSWGSSLDTAKYSSISPNKSPDITDSPLAHSVSGLRSLVELNSDSIQMNRKAVKRCDRDQMRMLASEAINQSPLHHQRRPSSVFAGLHFSRSGPANLLQGLRKMEDSNSLADSEEENEEKKPKKTVTFAEETTREKSDKLRYDFMTTSYLERVPPSLANIDWNIKKFSDPHQVLAVLGLEEYQNLFRDQEIDMDAFLLLDESSLRELGINKMGSRKKIRKAIYQLNESQLRI